jgi:hypothetical protein
MLTFADRRIAQIGEMIGFRSASQNGLFELDEVSDVRILPRPTGSDVREGTDSRGDLTRDSTITQKLFTNTSSPSTLSTIRTLDALAFAVEDQPLQVDAGMQNAVRPHGNVRFDPRSRGIDDGDTRGHELFVLAIAEVRRNDRKLTAAVDAENLCGIVENHRLDAEPALAIQADEVRQVILPARSRADGA